jgi:chromosome segregation ATPase
LANEYLSELQAKSNIKLHQYEETKARCAQMTENESKLKAEIESLNVELDETKKRLEFDVQIAKISDYFL